jgi:hypothetical protein
MCSAGGRRTRTRTRRSCDRWSSRQATVTAEAPPPSIRRAGPPRGRGAKRSGGAETEAQKPWRLAPPRPSPTEASFAQSGQARDSPDKIALSVAAEPGRPQGRRVLVSAAPTSLPMPSTRPVPPGPLKWSLYALEGKSAARVSLPFLGWRDHPLCLQRDPVRPH